MFESHVTIETIDEQDFLDICEINSLKPIVIVDDGGLKQMMTAKFHKVEMRDALVEMHQIAGLFSKVVRRKLEQIVNKRTQHVDFKYREYHSKFIVPIDKSEIFIKIVSDAGGHTSTNILKSATYKFMTTREPELHERLVNLLKIEFDLVGTIREHVVYDDNPHYDNNWHCFECPLKMII